jgi:hypothetical protein
LHPPGQFVAINRRGVTEGQPVILEIVVTEVESQQKRVENTGEASR